MDVVGELDLSDRSQTVHRGADRDSSNTELRERGIDHAVLTKAFLEAVSRAEHAAVDAHVFAEHDHRRVGFHLLHERLADGFDQGQLGHASLTDRGRAAGWW